MLRPSFANGFAPRDGSPIWPELWRGCVGAWNPGLGPTGLRLYDWSPCKNHASFLNLTADNAWKQNTILLSGADYLRLPSIPLGNQLTLSAWVRASNKSQAMIFNKSFVNSNWNMFWFGGTLFLRTTGLSQITASNPTLNTIEHIVGTVNNTTANLYINGVNVASGTVNPIANGAGTIEIGSYEESPGDGRFLLPGTIFDFSIYNRALHPNEIRLLATRPGIAYEMAPRRWSAAMIEAYRRRIQQQNEILGGGFV